MASPRNLEGTVKSDLKSRMLGPNGSQSRLGKKGLGARWLFLQVALRVDKWLVFLPGKLCP